jgi:hypothetical protein
LVEQLKVQQQDKECRTSSVAAEAMSSMSRHREVEGAYHIVMSDILQALGSFGSAHLHVKSLASLLELLHAIGVLLVRLRRRRCGQANPTNVAIVSVHLLSGNVTSHICLDIQICDAKPSDRCGCLEK